MWFGDNIFSVTHLTTLMEGGLKQEIHNIIKLSLAKPVSWTRYLPDF